MRVDEHFSHFFPPLAYQRQGQPSGGGEVLQLLVGGRGKKRKDDAESTSVGSFSATVSPFGVAG